MWCSAKIDVRPIGRIPTWCSNSCRHRAWEQRRAAASGLAARETVERVVEVEVPVRIVQEVEVLPRGRSWSGALEDLVHQLDSGRIYDRDLDDLAAALERVVEALHRRPRWRSAPGRRR